MLDRYNQVPENAKTHLLQLRNVILDVAESIDSGEVEESLKWGEPSFHLAGGSPIRIDWKEKTPDHYYLYFNCNSKLVTTFRELYSQSLQFEGNRAIVLTLGQPIPHEELQHCLRLAFTYHQIKHLPLLGA